MLKRLLLLLLLVSLLVVALPFTILAEPMYQISASELQSIRDNNSNIIKENQNLKQQLLNSNLNLNQFQDLLNKQEVKVKALQQTIATLINKLEQSEQTSTQASDQVNELKAIQAELTKSYNESLKEALKEIKRLKIERNLAIIGGIIGWILWLMK
jgi:uncharacterized protein YbcI